MESRILSLGPVYGLPLCYHDYSIHKLIVPTLRLPMTKVDWHQPAKSFYLFSWSVPHPWLMPFYRHYAIQRSSHLMSTPTVTCAQVFMYKDDWVTKWGGQCHWKKNLLFTFPEKRGHAMPCRATSEVLGLGQEAELEVRGKPRPEPLLGFPWGKAKQGRVNSLELADLNNSGRLWGIALAVSFLGLD